MTELKRLTASVIRLAGRQYGKTAAMMVEPKHLDGLAALIAAESAGLRKRKGERDTEYVKRIVCAYLNAARGRHPAAIRAAAVVQIRRKS